MDSNTVVTWPSGENVKIIVYWHVDGQTVSDEVMVTSEVVESSEEDFSIPWGGILGGLALGMVLIFAIRIKTSPKDEKDKKKKVKSSPKKDEKVEVACPTCDRRLNVPRTYTGGVRCPECETKFDVEGNLKLMKIWRRHQRKRLLRITKTKLNLCGLLLVMTF